MYVLDDCPKCNADGVNIIYLYTCEYDEIDYYTCIICDAEIIVDEDGVSVMDGRYALGG